jgi:dienelactone hydrolase/pimeloyl-ACP methyl ester carboxylesterase
MCSTTSSIRMPHDYPRMVHEYYLRRVREIMDRRSERIAALKSPGDAQHHVASARRAIRRSFGPFPQRTPLNARVTRRIANPGYDVENITFESRPSFLVTGNLYVPRQVPRGADRKGRLPAVLGLCGHADEGKAADVNQAFCQGLVRKGFVVFMIDPIAQGERWQFYRGGRCERPGLTRAHNLLGNQMSLAGEFFGAWRVWDAMRGLDYLLSRDEVDPARVGATGTSGGGTLTTWLTGLDPRLTMAAPSCFVCSFLANMQNELPSDSEQCPPGILGAGLDQADFLIAYAPRPTVILSEKLDFFDERYARRAYQDVRRIHELLGSRGTASYHAGHGRHGYLKDGREAMYRFFSRHAGVRVSAREPRIRCVEKEKLHATARGEVYRAGSKGVFEITRGLAQQFRSQRRDLETRDLRRAVRRVLAIPRSHGIPRHDLLMLAGGWAAGTGMRAQYAVETEAGIRAIVSSYGAEHHPARLPRGRATVYVGHIHGNDDFREIPALRRLVRDGKPLFVVDPRGLGHSVPRTCGNTEFLYYYGSDYHYASYGDMLGESYFGRRLFDVLRAVDFLLGNGIGKVHLVGRGLGSVIVLFVALLHKSQPSAELVDYLPSFHLLATSPRCLWPLSSLPRDCLRHFDLPDIYKSLGRRLRKSRPLNALMEPMTAREIRAANAPPRPVAFPTGKSFSGVT